MTADEFLDWITQPAKDVCQPYDLPWQVLVAQGAIESGWGNSKIGEYNLFGRKAVSGDKSISVATQEYEDGQYVTIQADFKDYDTLEEALDDWCQLMEWGPYQQYADQYHSDHDIDGFVNGIAGVYATDPDYSSKIMQTINACNLI